MAGFLRRLARYLRLRVRLSKAQARNRLTIRRWIQDGRPVVPPHAVKQAVLRQVARRHGLAVLVETGTFRCDMTIAMRHEFERIYTVELNEELFANARDVLSRFPHITVVHGDSGDVLPRILEQVDRPALFWLDGHYSGGETARGPLETPIMRELEHILKWSGPECAIMIDDAHCFIGRGDYPTLDQVRDFVAEHRPRCRFAAEHDILYVFLGKG